MHGKVEGHDTTNASRTMDTCKVVGWADSEWDQERTSTVQPWHASRGVQDYIILAL